MTAVDLLSSCLPKVRVPSLGDNVYKEECCLSFDTPESETGLYICMTTFLAFSHKYVKLYHAITSNQVFLHIKKTKKEVLDSKKSSESPSEKKPKRLAIGIEGGYDPDKEEKVEYDETHKIVILPEFIDLSLDDVELIPSLALTSANGILASTSASKKEEILAWDGEFRPVTKHGHSLEQLNNGVKIPPNGWKCSKCDLTNNLWLNLTDGTILCGRKYFDGSGGNNHAVEYFKETGYPLAVKLGTITASGADVHSYDEDTMVEDPYLAKHLTHFGINMMNMEKTEQTMTELEIELNEKIGSEWNIIQEAGKNLKELHGPGLTGMKNMGNTCYLNSLIQVFLSIPEFQHRYINVDKCHEVFKKHLATLKWDPANPSSGLGEYANQANVTSNKLNDEIQKRVADITGDFTLQMCKVGLALNCLQCPDTPPSEEKDPDEEAAAASKELLSKTPLYHPISPSALKRTVGKDHPEFSTNRQQDAHEFLLHVLSVMERSDMKSGNSSVGDCFKFTIEERIECQQSKQVRYKKRTEYALSLPVPIEQATNKAEVEAYTALKEANAKNSSVAVGDVVRARVPFQACIDCFVQDENLLDFWSSAVKEKSEARKRTRFAAFPKYLVVQLKKFTVGADWVPKKLDVAVGMPDFLDLSQYRGTGLQENEVLLPDIDPPSANPGPDAVQVDEEVVFTISQMGFPLDRCRAAVVATGNQGAEPAVMWLMENPATDPGPAPVQTTPAPPDESISMIIGMGFTHDQAVKALRATNNNLERAADWIFSHLDELDSIDPDPPASNAGDVAMDVSVSAGVTDGPGTYELFAFISHMGTSTMCGHYVCHISKHGRWVIFNDEKVAESEAPPRELGYIYFYRRAAE